MRETLADAFQSTLGHFTTRNARAAGRFVLRLRGFAVGALIAITIWFLMQPVPGPNRFPTTQRDTRPTAAYVTTSAWGQQVTVHAEGQIDLGAGGRYTDLVGLIEISVVNEFTAGRRDAAFRIIEAINDEDQKAASLFKLLERVRTLEPYRGLISREDFDLISTRFATVEPAAVVPRPADAPTGTTPEAQRLRTEEFRKELEAEIQEARHKAKPAEATIIDAVVGQLSRASSIASTLQDEESRAAILFAISDNQRALRRSDAGQTSLEDGIAALNSARNSETFLGLGIDKWIGIGWTILFGLAMFFKEPLHRRFGFGRRDADPGSRATPGASLDGEMRKETATPGRPK